MKRLSTLLCLVLISTACFSQNKLVAPFASEVTSKTADTVVNATTKNQILKVAKPATVLSIQVTAKKISGTTAGVVRLFGSNDKVVWKRITATGTLSAADSLNLANVTPEQSIFFFDTPSRYLYYRASVTGAGTASTRFSTTAVAAQ